jgi:hypothetical protein
MVLAFCLAEFFQMSWCLIPEDSTLLFHMMQCL